MVYPALLPLMRTPRLPKVDWTDARADLNGLVRFAERRNVVFARVPSHFKRSLPLSVPPVTCQTRLRYVNIMSIKRFFLWTFLPCRSHPLWKKPSDERTLDLLWSWRNMAPKPFDLLLLRSMEMKPELRLKSSRKLRPVVRVGSPDVSAKDEDITVPQSIGNRNPNNMAWHSRSNTTVRVSSGTPKQLRTLSENYFEAWKARVYRCLSSSGNYFEFEE